MVSHFLDNSGDEMPKPKLLVLTPRFPFPLFGGDVLRIYRLCEQLKSDWDITLVSICQSAREINSCMPSDSPFSAVHKIWLPKWRSYINTIWGFISGKPLQIAYYQSNEMAKRVAELSAGHAAVMCHLLRTAPYALDFVGVKVLELTDHLPLTYMRSNATKGKTGLLRRIVYKVEMRRIESAQVNFSKLFDIVSFVSDVDRNCFIETVDGGCECAITAGNGICLNDRTFESVRLGRKIAFIGNMAAMPNSDAVAFFAEVIFPSLLELYPDLVFKVIGPIDNALRRRLEKNPLVEVIGVAESIDVATKDCVIGVCPIRIGAGVQNKVLDYMALGLATVTTSLGAEGIDGSPGEHFLVADTEKSFVEAISGLLEDADLRAKLALNARFVIERSYSWSAKVELLKTSLATCLTRTSGFAENHNCDS